MAYRWGEGCSGTPRSHEGQLSRTAFFTALFAHFRFICSTAVDCIVEFAHFFSGGRVCSIFIGVLLVALLASAGDGQLYF
jgi:hypothetical protein